MTKTAAILIALALAGCGADTTEAAGTWRFVFGTEPCFDGDTTLDVTIPPGIGISENADVELENGTGYTWTDNGETWNIVTENGTAGGYDIDLTVGESPTALVRFQGGALFDYCMSEPEMAQVEKLSDG